MVNSATLHGLIMKTFPFTALAFAVAVLTSCSITKDAQRGISFEFQHLHQGRHSDHGTRSESTTAKAGVPAQYQEQESAQESALVGEGMALRLTLPEWVDPTVGANDYLDEPNEELEAITPCPDPRIRQSESSDSCY